MGVFVAPFLIGTGFLPVDFWGGGFTGDHILPPLKITLKALSLTLLQSGLSATSCVIVGFFCSWGLLGINNKHKAKKILEIFLCLPAFLPSSVVLSAVMSWVPRGLWGVVLVHIISNLGLISVMWWRVLQTRLSECAALAYAEGSSRLHFWQAVSLTLLRPFVFLFAFVFFICVGSFAVPIVLMQGLGYTLEGLMYLKIQKLSTWGQAWGLGLLQMGVGVVGIIFAPFIAAHFYESNTTKHFSPKFYHDTIHWLSVRWVLVIPFICGALLLSLFGPGAWKGMAQILAHPRLWQEFSTAAKGSLQIVLGVSVMTFFLGLGICFLCTRHMFLHRFLMVYVPPSSIMLGFGLLLSMYGFGVFYPKFFMCVGLFIVGFPFAYRLVLGESLAHGAPQMAVASQMAKIMGAGVLMRFLYLQLPYLWAPIFISMSCISFWALGDFSVSAVISTQNSTLALMLKSFLGSYHQDIAQAIALAVLIFGTFVAILFWNIGHGLSKKFGL